MYTDTYNSANPLTEESLLGSEYFNPEYLFNNLIEIAGPIFSAKTLHIIYVVLSFLAMFFIAVIIYTTIRMFEVRKKEHLHLQHEIAGYARNQALREKEMRKQGVFKSEKWEKVLDYLFSVNENDWKLAVIEADLMLFDLLTHVGFKGENVGDKLKEADRNNFRNLSSAWEAHNVRNKIAHEGSSFVLSQHEAKRVIALYEQIFGEFGYI